MRYARFRTLMVGAESPRRNPASVSKPRASRSKKEQKAKKLKDEAARGGPDTVHALVDEVPAAASPKIKQETERFPPQDPPVSKPTPQAATPFSPDAHTQHYQRLLTPCSDSEMPPITRGYAASPASELLHPDVPFDYTGTAHCSHGHAAWQQGTPYAAFTMPSGLATYATGFCEQHHADALCVPGTLMEPGADVRHEEWSAHFHEA